jgi:hypothetical protein
MFMTLVELFASRRFPKWTDRLVFLNGEYRKHNEIAELRLRGYDRLADRLERQPARH